MALTDYKIDSDYLATYGINLGDPSLNANEGALIQEAYDEVIDYVFYCNDYLAHAEQAICDHLEDTEIDDDADDDETQYDKSADKIAGFKRAQYLVLRNILTTNVNPITEEVHACLSGRCGLIKKNGFQKN